MQKRERDYPIEKLIMEHMKKLIRTQMATDRKKVYESFSSELKRLIHGPEDSIVMKYFDFQIWLESKMRGISFEEAIRSHE